MPIFDDFYAKKAYLEFSEAFFWIKFSKRWFLIPIIFGSLDFQLGNPNKWKLSRGQKYAYVYLRLNTKIHSKMLCCRGFALFSRWVALKTMCLFYAAILLGENQASQFLNSSSLMTTLTVWHLFQITNVIKLVIWNNSIGLVHKVKRFWAV